MNPSFVPPPPARPAPGQPVAATKLNPPSTSPVQVPRTAISERIRHAGPVKLVLVRAPAGFGKTTAMLQARAQLEAAGTTTAWLTLDRADNDVSRFLNCLREAVAPLAGDSGEDPASFDVVAALSREGAPFSLFLDDFELISEPAVHGLVREIIDHLPRRGQLVLGSRSLPDLGLGHLRARGQLLEIDAELLRFSLEEAGEFFRLRQQQAMPLEAVSQLHNRTEGWIAALWLASMALERHGEGSDFVERFSGSERAVADYLAEDVLAHQSAEVRDFLLRTSILRHLNASLCQALNPRLDGARILQQIDAASLFLTPIAGEPHTYRYHSLFADFLRAQLARERPDEFARLHLAASGWYESQGRPVPAIDHAIEGGDFPHALSLLAQHAEQFLEQGRMRLLSRWFAAFPPSSLQPHPRLQVVAIWAACFTHGPWEAMALLEQSDCARSDDAAVHAHLNAQRPLLLAMMDRYEDAYAAGRDSLGRLPSCKPFADSVLSNAMAHIATVMGEQHEAHRLLDAARRTQRGSAFNRMYTETMEGVLDLQGGRLRQATARFRMAVSSTPGISYNHANGNAWAGVFYAGAIYETNQLAQAEHLFNVYLPLARDVGLPDHMILSHVMRSRIAFHQGDIDRAFQVLTELEYLGHHRQLPRVVASAKLERARMLLMQGNAQAAKAELDRADDRELWERVRRQRLSAHDLEDMAIGRLRWEVAFGDVRQALPRLVQEIGAATGAARHRRALKLRLLHSLALYRHGDLGAAVDTLTHVLQHTCQEGFVRLLLDEGDAVGPLIAACHAALQENPPRRSDPLLGDYLQRLLETLGSPSHDGPELPAVLPASGMETESGMLERLTRTEIRVLQLLAEGYSNSAMTEKLFVSDSTVRTHLRNINMKLGAHSRTQAVAIARRLSVIR